MNWFVRPCAGSAMVGGVRAFLFRLRLLFLLAFVAVLPSRAHGQFQELITHGNFEMVGAEWRINVTNHPTTGNPGCGSATVPASNCWFLNSPGLATPLFGLPTNVGAEHGLYAIADMTVVGNRELFQTFFVPEPNRPVLLSFDLFVNDWASLTAFDERQHARVDITTNTATPFETGAGVLFNAYLGTDGGPLPNPFRHYEFDISPVVAAGGNFRVRFFAVNLINNGLPINIGVDNVSVRFIPEPGTMGLAAVALSAAIAVGCRRKSWMRPRVAARAS
jgi:hypothetical protein